jgi:OOP family OmpA-OmpF porin
LLALLVLLVAEAIGRRKSPKAAKAFYQEQIYLEPEALTACPPVLFLENVNMKLTKTVGTLSVLAAALLASGFAQAQTTSMARPAFDSPEWADHAWYIGTGIGQGRAKMDNDRLVRALTTGGATGAAVSGDDKDVGYKFFVGKQMSRNFAVELGYSDLGEYTFNGTTTSPAGNFGANTKFRGATLDAIIAAPLSQAFSIYGRLGVNYTKATVDMNGTRIAAGVPRSIENKRTNPHVGLGVEYKFNEALALRAEYERYHISDPLGLRNQVNQANLQLVYKLGRPAAKPPVVIAPPPPPPPAPVAEPAPAPTPAPAPVPVSEKVTFNAEALFDFDKAVVKPEGRAALDDLLGKLQGMNTEVMVTVGHTDSIGSDAYNQKLSIRRAEAVKAYLVSKGVEQSRVYTEGKGESQPVADNKSAAGRAKNRRVTVEVVGNRTTTR